jgi:predicted RNase H-like nuclease (RuvC/YqgF family)
MDNNLLILAGISLLAVLLTYIVTKRSADKKVGQYKSIDEALKKAKEEHETLKKANESLQQTNEIAKQALSKINAETADLQALKGQDDSLKVSILEQQQSLDAAQNTLNELNANIEKSEQDLNELMGGIDLYSRLDEYTAHGHFEMPQYLYGTSTRYSEEIKDIRQQQKDMIKAKTAVTFPETTVISNDKSLNKKILNGQVKLMLTAFNIECDMLIGKVSPSSFGRTLERIEKLANNLEKSAATMECGFDIDYIELKFEECKLQYQYTLKKQEEIAEQKLIKEQIREEQRAIKEFEKAIAEAEKEEKMYRNLLDKAQQELAQANEQERSEMEQRIAILELQLAEAEAKEERAKSMAEQTRKGHVYVISNIGSFGEDVYKIGLTRRLEPMDRVKELGDASVPFPFDVHAMIYTDDAPALETALHREFHSQRVNAVNIRKEFFSVDLEEIKDAVEKIAGVDAQFKMTALAEDYYESLRLSDAA